MTAIAGMTGRNKKNLVKKMLGKMAHRGNDWLEMATQPNAVIGISGTAAENLSRRIFKKTKVARDGLQAGWFSQAKFHEDGIALSRDTIGVTPLYYGWTADGEFCFASEVKALLLVTENVRELEPGSTYNDEKSYGYHFVVRHAINDEPGSIATELRTRLERAVDRGIKYGSIGSWLSGGLDSSALAAIAAEKVSHIPTFAAGLDGAPDLRYARMMAEHIGADHHEITVTRQQIYKTLPEVIFHLESFDALLIRSSVLNYIAARAASDYVSTVFSGEGGDELFAGYTYLKSIDISQLAPELIDMLNSLHNTALQRVDRCSAAHSTKAFVAFLDPEVVNYSIRIPVKYKLVSGTEKWILRMAVRDLLPPEILNRPKEKFWEGAGINELIALYADEQISDKDFSSTRTLSSGLRLNTKEEMLYYRIFEEQFGELRDLTWVGRTKGSPVN